MARILNVSAVHLGRLAKDGAIPGPIEKGRWDVIAVTNAMLAHIEGKADKTGDVKSEELRLTIARRIKVEGEISEQEMRNAVTRGDLLLRSDVTAIVTASFARVRARLLAIPSKVAPFLLGVVTLAKLKELIADAVNEALAELAATTVVGLSESEGEPSDA